MSTTLNSVKKTNIDRADTAYAYVEQFGAGIQSLNVVKLQKEKVCF